VADRKDPDEPSFAADNGSAGDVRCTNRTGLQVS
jgi:hypothetical protein